jgi:hypothetical protein
MIVGHCLRLPYGCSAHVLAVLGPRVVSNKRTPAYMKYTKAKLQWDVQWRVRRVGSQGTRDGGEAEQV